MNHRQLDPFMQRLHDRADAVGGFLTVGGEIIRAPERKQDCTVGFPCELFFTNKCDNTFGVRYDNGDEKIVPDTPDNRYHYSQMIEVYRERMDRVMKL